jgi:hypothetical protein
MTMDELRMTLISISSEKVGISLAKYNARWETGSPQLIDNAKRLKELIALEKQTKHSIMILKYPTWTPPVRKPRPPPPPKPTKTKALSAAKLDVCNEDNCGICMESHTLRNSVHTSCGHCFGSVCYEIMLKHNLNSGCPMCRAPKPCLTFYKQRKQCVKLTKS